MISSVYPLTSFGLCGVAVCTTVSMSLLVTCWKGALGCGWYVQISVSGLALLFNRATTLAAVALT